MFVLQEDGICGSSVAESHVSAVVYPHAIAHLSGAVSTEQTRLGRGGAAEESPHLHGLWKRQDEQRTVQILLLSSGT